MDIFNRPPSISEDTIQYTLYPPPALAEKSSATTLAACVQVYVSELLPNFLWHRDPFEVKVAKDIDTAAVRDNKWMLEGRMRVGDSIDDEWCVVWVLREISKKWDFAISVMDSDGEFLLIEAAEALPPWVKPSNSENRVWIHSGILHLIPLQHISAPSKPKRRRRFPGSKDSDDEGDIVGDDLEEYLAIDDALKLVRDATVDTRAPRTVENTVWQRISGYPAAAKTHVHTTKVYLPLDIARALSINPSLAQKPVETFYTRDAVQLRAAHRMTRFPPHSAVLTTVKLTKPAYAQLVGQKFFPPKIFGYFKEREGSDIWRWRDIGMKLACGFEMIYQESKSRADIVSKTTEVLKSSAEARKEALRRSSDYKAYITNLVSAGYFRGEVEDSQLWNELENKAADAFIQVRQEDDATRPSFAALFNSALSTAPEYLTEMPDETEDSDDWMNVDAAGFDDMLERTRSQPQSQAMDVDAGDDAEERVAKEQTSKLQDLAAKVQNFVEGEGDVEGARFEDEAFSDDEDDGDDADEEDEENFSDEKFSDSDDEGEPDEAARQEAMAKLVPALSEAEYGQMPASFNTQRVSKVTIETETVDGTDLAIAQSPATEPALEVTSPARTRSMRPPILPRDEYEGVDSDDESSNSDPLAGGDEEDVESEEDRPQVVGDIEVDMDEEEAEFLEFSRQALGISDQQWGDIIKDRKGRGAFVPTSVTAENTTSTSTRSPNNKSDSFPPQAQGRQPVPGPRPNVNPNLDSFEAVMQAMDAELNQSRHTALKGKAAAVPKGDPVMPSKGKSKSKFMEEDGEEDLDIEAQMEAELKAMLEHGGGDMEEIDSGEEEVPMDYNLIKNFLESFKSQAGLSGPVGNLAGRLQPGWTFPRDDS
ncbi:SGT1 protein-domain-containing protein [Suillus clintonianus]|uniref:SGT1 protein-domain-containing protein n=1 Tax=Suillus clintonianus TaxID=1904413 RepID=UPI001B85DBB8|nr:SGT1 protein-domain-containing protein [Suillus clintonianus]KAG2155460.1 SGT1 protein-domain-containing protein [Suillus clintonianus]